MNPRTAACLVILSVSVTVAASAQATDDATKQTDKVRRYLSLGMYEEAASSLKDLLASDEFNSDKRYLYGIALEGLEKHREAAAQLELSMRLDPKQWRALLKLPSVYMAAYNESGSNTDRKKAYHASVQLTELQNPVLDSQSDKTELQHSTVLARDIIARLDSPIGVWKSPSGTAFVIGMFYSPPQLAIKEMLPRGATSCGHVCWSSGVKGVAGPDYTGSGANTPIQSIGAGCMFDYDYELRLADAGTVLTVVETAKNYRGPEPTRIVEVEQSQGLGAARAAYKTADEACRKFSVPAIVGRSNEIVLERLSASVP